MSGIGVLTNPRSRRNRRDPRLARRLGYILGERHHFETPTDLDELAATMLRFRDHEIDVLCVNGGDGTVHTAITALVNAYGDAPLPKIALLRGGTMNTIAHGLGIRGTPAQLLEDVVTRYHADAPFPTARRRTLRVGALHGFLFGNGLIAHFLEAYYEGSEPSPAKAVALLARASASAPVNGPFIRRLMRPFRGTVEVDGVEWAPREWLTVAAGTVDDIGLGFRPFPRCLEHPGKMHGLGLACTPWDVVRALPRIRRALPMQGDGVFEAPCASLVLRADEPISFMIDGDFHRGGTEVRVTTGPDVDFVLPGVA